MTQTGDTFLGRNGKIYVLREKLGEGGEGAVYRTDDSSLVAKLYKKPTEAAERKIRSMLKHSINLRSPGGIPIITWPQDILYQNGRFAGYVMPCVSGGSPIWKLGRANGREEIFNHQYDWSKALAVAANLASLVAYLHARDIIVGDMNSNNICVHPNGYVTIMDVDSFDIRDRDTGEHFKCTVGRPEYLAPELQLRRSLSDEASEFTEQTDDFALAVHIFQILFLAHPFNMKMIDRPEGSKGENQQAEAIVEGSCPFVQAEQEDNIQPGVPYLSMLPDYLQKDFKETFSYNALNSVKRKDMRTKAAVWYQDLAKLYQEKDKTLIRCTADKRHYYLDDGRGCELCRAKQRMDDYNKRMMQWNIRSAVVNKREDDEATSLASVSFNDRWYLHYKVDSSPLNMSIPLYVRRTYPNGETTEITQLPKPYRTGDTISIEGSMQRAEQKRAGTYKIELFDSKKQLLQSSSICIIEPAKANKVSADSPGASGSEDHREKNALSEKSLLGRILLISGILAIFLYVTFLTNGINSTIEWGLIILLSVKVLGRVWAFKYIDTLTTDAWITYHLLWKKILHAGWWIGFIGIFYVIFLLRGIGGIIFYGLAFLFLYFLLVGVLDVCTSSSKHTDTSKTDTKATPTKTTPTKTTPTKTTPEGTAQEKAKPAQTESAKPSENDSPGETPEK